MIRKTRAGRPAARRTAEASAGAESLTDQAYRAIEELIVTLQLAPGTSASEAELSARVGIGRTPIREALQRLAREKLVAILPRRGILVSEINVGTQLRLLELRREVERLLVRRAARLATAEMRLRFAAIDKGMQAAARTNDDLAFMRLDREFNLLCIDAAENEFAAAAMALMNGLSRRFWYQHYRRVADMPLAARLHGAVARAIAAGDAEAAAAASDRLVDYIAEFTRAAVDPG
ncbi:MAG: GntR family transcriptional regulator [Alphaproteobacteria bacterium]|nr:GntR family transcriptional regulator [Alphaproteobacteria bacterium]